MRLSSSCQAHGVSPLRLARDNCPVLDSPLTCAAAEPSETSIELTEGKQ